MAKTLHDLNDFQKELLKQEIELIDKTIARIDHIQINMQNWAILIWGGSLFLIVQHLDQSWLLILLTAVIPCLFGFLDVIWRRQLLKVNYREKKISDFINENSEEENFIILDPIGEGY